MRKYLVLLLSALIAPLILFVPAAHAQEIPSIEITGGYLFMRNGLMSNDLPITFTQPPPSGQGFSSFHANGWTVSVVENYNHWLGVEQEISGDYGTPQFFGSPLTAHSFSILSGPHFAHRTYSRFTPYAHALFGYRHMSNSVGGLSFSDNSYALEAGAGLNVHVAGPVAIRLVQADYMLSRFYRSTQNNLRVSAGIVFEFGRHRRY